MRIAAVSDIHCPRYLSEFEKALEQCTNPDVLLLAGDMIEAGRFAEYRKIVEVITSRFGDDLPVVACQGNDEYGADVTTLQEISSDRIIFLNSSSSILTLDDQTLGIVGIPPVTHEEIGTEQDIEGIFAKRISDLKMQIIGLKHKCDKMILLMHYSPISPESFPISFSWWLSQAFDNNQPDIVIHGHIHYATNPEASIGHTRILNVAFPATRKMTEITLH